MQSLEKVLVQTLEGIAEKFTHFGGCLAGKVIDGNFCAIPGAMEYSARRPIYRSRILGPISEVGYNSRRIRDSNLDLSVTYHSEVTVWQIVPKLPRRHLGLH